jgi:hypothetical protein
MGHNQELPSAWIQRVDPKIRSRPDLLHRRLRHSPRPHDVETACDQLGIDTDLFLSIFNIGEYKYAAANDTPINNSKKFLKEKWRATIDHYLLESMKAESMKNPDSDGNRNDGSLANEFISTACFHSKQVLTY